MSSWLGAGGPRIRLLGECRMGDAGRLTYRKGWALLAYLAVERTRSHRRSLIAAMLWPDLPHPAALTNLRQVLTDLNRAIVAVAGEGVLLIDRETVRLCPDASHGLLDIDLLEISSRACHVSGSMAAQKWLQEAGEMLEGVDPEQCEEFCEWLSGARSWVWQRLLKSLQSACDEAVASGDLRSAVGFVRRQVALDPWREVQQRRLMTLYRQLGEPDIALNCYRQLERSLRRELAIEPEMATRMLALEIARGAGCTVPVGGVRPRSAAAPCHGRVVSTVIRRRRHAIPRST